MRKITCSQGYVPSLEAASFKTGYGENIFRIHFSKRNRDPDIFDIPGFVVKTKGFNGAEIEQLIIPGLYRAFAGDREIEDKDIHSKIEETVPLSVTYKEHIAALRTWAETRARAAT